MEKFKEKKLNFKTINVFNYVNKDRSLMDIAKDFDSFKQFSSYVAPFGIYKTSDEVNFDDEDLDVEFLDQFVQCLH